MAKAYKCDRCGAFYDYYIKEIPVSLSECSGNVNGIILTWTLRDNDDCGGRSLNIDLCPQCMDYILEELVPISRNKSR